MKRLKLQINLGHDDMNALGLSKGNDGDIVSLEDGQAALAVRRGWAVPVGGAAPAEDEAPETGEAPDEAEKGKAKGKGK